ncbi:MAG: DUF5711 family protein [Clostridia bacterium]
MDKRKTRKEIIIREGQKKVIEEVDISHEEYYATKEQLEKVKERQKEEPTKKKNPTLKVCLVILITVISLVLYYNQANLSFESVTFWVKTQVVGSGVGDGYPVSVVGSTVSSENFISNSSNSVVLSDTALSIYSETGKELLSTGHEYNNPVLKNSGDYFLIYGINQTNYSIYTVNSNISNSSVDYAILSADIASNGTYIIASQSVDFTSEFSVYSVKGVLQYTYKFANGYISSVVLNSSATGGAVSIVYSSDGIMCTDIYVFDFTSADPVAVYTSSDNVILNIIYNSDSQISAVGNNKVSVISSDKLSEYSYESNTLSAVSTENNQIIISLVNATGESTIVVFQNLSEVVEFQVNSYVDHISSYGQSIAVLTEDKVECYNLSGTLIGISDASYDTKAIALSSESNVYMLGLSKIEYVSLNPV